MPFALGNIQLHYRQCNRIRPTRGSCGENTMWTVVRWRFAHQNIPFSLMKHPDHEQMREAFGLIHNEVVMKDFRQLKVWEKAHLLALARYPITARFPAKKLMDSRLRFGGLLRRFPPTSLKAAVEMAMLNWLAFALLREAQPLNWNIRSEEHTSELQSLAYLVCRLLLEKKKKNIN